MANYGKDRPCLHRPPEVEPNPEGHVGHGQTQEGSSICLAVLSSPPFSAPGTSCRFFLFFFFF